MAWDSSTSLEQIGQEAVDSLSSGMRNLDNEVCTIRNVSAIDGKLPYLPSAFTLGQDGGALAIGSAPVPIELSQSSIDYTLKRYARSLSLDESEIADLDQYHNIVGEVAGALLEYNAVARQRDLAAVITDSAQVGQEAASNGNWSVETSTPVLDIHNAKYNDAPDADSVIMSRKTAFELSRHPDITAMAGFGYASGGTVDDNGLFQVIRTITGVQNVYVFETFYNSAGAGETATLAYVQDEFFGLYNKAGLIKVCQTGKQSKVSVFEKHGIVEWAVSDTCTFVTCNDFRITEVTGL